MSAEQLLFDGRRIKIKTQERAAKSDAGVIVDYLRVTVRRDAIEALSFIPQGAMDSEITRLLAVRWAELVGFQFGEVRGKGRDYYEHTCTIWNDNGREVGSVSGGGEHQAGTFCFTLKGEGCTYAAPGWERTAYEFFNALEAKITRVDLARDFFDGESGGVESVRDAYRQGLFNYNGRKPSCDQNGDWEHGKSRTWYVGKRESGKVFRGYEKDHQFGNLDGKWWRAEVELRSHQRIIPLESLIRPSSFFAGAYEYCAQLLQHVQPQKVSTGHKVAEASIESCIRWIERTVAPALVHISLNSSFDWLMQVTVEHAHRPLPKALKGLTSSAIKSGCERALKRFSSAAPPSVAPSPLAA